MKKVFKIYFILLLFIFIFSFLLIGQTGDFGENNNIDNEEILEFNSIVKIDENGDIIVHEILFVNCLNIKINHGIYRDLPKYENINKIFPNNLNLKIIEGKVDDKNSIAKIEKIDNNLRIYLGNKDKIIQKGVHKFELVYSYSNIIKKEGDLEIFYFNITGNNWDFKINKCKTKIIFPEKLFYENNINFNIIDGFTGFKGEKKKEFVYFYSIEKKNIIEYETTSPLKPGEGFTVYLSWDHQIFIKNESKNTLSYYFNSNPQAIISIIGTILVFLYFFIIWLIKGKDPKKTKLPPSDSIIGNFSAAAIRYLFKMGFNPNVLSIALMSLASKKAIKLKINKEKTIIEKSDNDIENCNLTEDEKFLYDLIINIIDKNNLVSGKNTEGFEINFYNYNILSKELKKYYDNKYKNVYFTKNSIYFVIGLLLSFLVIILSFVVSPISFQNNFFTLFVIIFGFIIINLNKITKDYWRNVKSKGIGTALFLSFFNFIFTFVFIVLFISFFFLTTFYFTFITFLSIVGLILINFLFAEIIDRPTEEGIHIYEGIDALRRYILEFPQIKKENDYEIEPLILYALALDLKGDRFFENISLSIQDKGQYFIYNDNYMDEYSYINLKNFFNILSSHISQSSSSSSSSSSSGSSGGGSGGGGGGGW